MHVESSSPSQGRHLGHSCLWNGVHWVLLPQFCSAPLFGLVHYWPFCSHQKVSQHLGWFGSLVLLFVCRALYCYSSTTVASVLSLRSMTNAKSIYHGHHHYHSHTHTHTHTQIRTISINHSIIFECLRLKDKCTSYDCMTHIYLKMRFVLTR